MLIQDLEGALEHSNKKYEDQELYYQDIVRQYKDQLRVKDSDLEMTRVQFDKVVFEKDKEIKHWQKMWK